MQILIIVLVISICVLVLVLLAYQRQIRDICRQLAFLQENDSNMMITASFPAKSIRNLTDRLNAFLRIRREERSTYQKKEKNISDIYTNISHDIRTPLTSLDGYFQLLEQARDEQEQARYVGIIQERISSLKDMLEELFGYTKLENGSYELELSSCCISRILKETVFSYYEECSRRGIKPEFGIPDELVYVLGNEQALHRVLRNIIKNALDHGAKKIRIILEKQPEQVVLRVSNQVIGIEQIDVERVFERFYKAEKSRSTNSTGLGLAIARELVLRMGGTIEAQTDGEEFGIVIGLKSADGNAK